MTKNKTLPLFLLLILLIFNSCIGLSMDIQMKKDGSGRLNLEYRFSGMAEAIGRLDGNENWPIIPTGRADFERTVLRVDGLRLVSFSSRERSGEFITNAELEFSNPQALLRFLDPTGTNASISSEKFDIFLNIPSTSNINPDLLDLVKSLSADYKLTISFSAEGLSTMRVTDRSGRELPSSVLNEAQIVPSGRKVSFSIAMSELLGISEGLGFSFSR